MMINTFKDKNKAKSLKNIADITLERLSTTDIIKYPTNSLIDYYDILHKFMEAISFIDGIKFKGEGAHQELIDYICKRCRFRDNERTFLQQIRDYRNRISYEGFFIKANYIESNQEKIVELLTKLNNVLIKELNK